MNELMTNLNRNFFPLTFMKAFDSLLMQLHESLLFHVDDFGILLNVVFEWKDEVDIKRFQLRNKTAQLDRLHG